MVNLSKLVNRDLINLKNDSKNKKDFFESAFEKLKDKGFVNESFLKAIIGREDKYPTGLELPEVSIAIPHTDVEHIREPFIYINKVLSSDLTFIQMGTDDEVVKPEYIIVLGIDDPKNQVGLLSELMEVFSNVDFINDLNNSVSEEEVFRLFKKEEE